MVLNYAAVQGQFESAYKLVQSPGTKTKTTVAGKDDLKRLLERRTREIAGMLRMKPEVTPVDRVSLGIPQLPHKGAIIPPPQTVPVVNVESVRQRRIDLQLSDSDALHRKAMAKGTALAVVAAFVGDETPPANPRDWPYQVMTSKSKVILQLRDDVPSASRVLIVARWESPTCKPGPWGRVVTTYLQGGLAVLPKSRLKAA